MIVQSDDVCEMYLTALGAWILAGPDFWLRLFTNNVPLDPSIENPASYVEASYPGYAAFGTLGLWSLPVRDQAGVWHVQAGPFTFAVNGGLVPVTTYGWYIQRGTRVVFMAAFDSAITILPGQPGPTLLPQLTQASQTAICAGP